MAINDAVFHTHASENTKYHALYNYFTLRKTRTEIATIFGKAKSTIGNWIYRYQVYGTVARIARDSTYLSIPLEKREWLIELYDKNPLMYLDEAKFEFMKHWNKTISESTVWNILQEAGYTLKTVERRAIEIKEADIIRFYFELDSLYWSPDNLLFLDEVSFDNRAMVRRKGYCLRGTKLLFRGEFTRKPRVSLLCFINVNGLLESFMTEDTFNRDKFVECIRNLIKSGVIEMYPGRNSIWILDGAKIHCHPDITYYLRSCGIVPLFLPAYCPFYNPIEIMFGLVKKRMQRHYAEGHVSDSALSLFVASEMAQFRDFDMRNLYRKCGYDSAKRFDPGHGFSDIGSSVDNDLLGFESVGVD